MLIQPDGLLGGLDRHIEYLLSRTAYCVVGPVWRSPRVRRVAAEDFCVRPVRRSPRVIRVAAEVFWVMPVRRSPE